MTPYTKQIVELHKIHKAIENCKGGGDVTPEPSPDGGSTEDTTIAHTIFWPMQYLPIAMCLESELWNEINNQNPDWNRIESRDASYIFSLENVNLYYTHEDIEHLDNTNILFLYPEEEFELHPEYEINGIGGPGFTNDYRIDSFSYGNIPIKVKINNKVYVTMMYSD